MKSNRVLSAMAVMLCMLFGHVHAMEEDRAIFDLISKGDKEGVSQWLNEGRDIEYTAVHWDGHSNLRPPFGYMATPLLTSVRHQKEEIVAFLLEKKADPNRQIGDSSPLAEAISRGYLKIAQLLVKNEANPDAVVCNASTLLQTAIMKAKTKEALMLLEIGANPNLTGPLVHLRPICIASGTGCFLSNFDVFRALLSHKDIRLIPDEDEELPPLHMVSKDSFYARMLICRFIHQLYTQSVSAGKAAQRMVEFMNSKNKHGNTAAHCAASLTPSNHPDVPDVLYMLCSLGADPNAQNNNGDTPMHLHRRAKKKGHSKYRAWGGTVGLLRAFGARDAVPNNEGQEATISDEERQEENQWHDVWKNVLTIPTYKYPDILTTLGYNNGRTKIVTWREELEISVGTMQYGLEDLEIDHEVLTSEKFSEWIEKFNKKIRKKSATLHAK